MRKNFFWHTLPIPLLVLVGCRSTENVDNTILVERRTISNEIVFSAKVLPYKVMSGKAGMAGYVVSVEKIPGMKIVKGDIIAHISDSNNQLRTLMSGFTGTLVSIQFAPGQSTNVDDVFYKVGDVNKKVMQADLDEIDVRKLKVGQTFLVDAKASQLQGTVIFINSLGTETEAGTRFKVAGTIDDPKNTIDLMGVAVPVKVVIGQVDSVLSVEKRALLTKGEKYFVRLSKAGRTSEREVRKGLENEQFVEISGDVHENDRVIID